MSRLAVLTLFAVTLLTSQLSWADEAAAEKPAEAKSPIVSLTLHPAKEPVPALKYQLLPPLLDRKPGNAAVLYNKLLYVSGKPYDEFQTQLADWLDLPADKLPLDEIRQALSKYESLEADLHMAARREQCNWEQPIRERTYITLTLPEIQQVRSYARLLAMRARLQVAEHKYDDATYTLQSGFSLARHVGESPILVSALVALATVQVMCKPVQDWIEQPGSPNLYWALTSLPQPIISFHDALQSESAMLYLSYPELQPQMREKLKPEVLDRIINQVISELAQVGMAGNATELGAKVSVAALAVKGLPTARARLIERGRTKQELYQMKPVQIVVVDALETFEELRDRIHRHLNLPYWQAAPLIEAEQKWFEEVGKKREVLPVAGLLMPAMGRAYFAKARVDRNLAMLRVVEALRLHGVTTQGKLPASLDDVHEVPLPLDPTTGKPFEYQLQGDQAVLWSTGPIPAKAIMDGMTYELRMTE